MASMRRLSVRSRMLSMPLVLAALAGAVGCTMCPDPLDYSGPVPNGSSPQNNFRARSNGILPLGTAPRPWPPLVQAPTPASPLPENVIVQELEAEDDADDGQPTPAEEASVAVAGDADETRAAAGILALEPATEPAVVR